MIFLALASVVIALIASRKREMFFKVLESNGYALLKNKRFPPVAVAAVRSPII